MNQDPYLLIRSLPSGDEVKTGHVWGGGTKPKWDLEKHSARLLLKLPPGDHSLVFEIKNKNVMVEDELIGSATMDINAIPEGTAQTISPVPLPVVTGGGNLVLSVFRRLTADDRDLQEALARSMNGGVASTDWSGGAFGGGGTSGGGSGASGGGNRLGGTSAPMSADERRAAAAAAAEARQKDWRQGGAVGGDPSKAAALAERRQKDELIGKIEAAYKGRGQVKLTHPMESLNLVHSKCPLPSQSVLV